MIEKWDPDDIIALIMLIGLITLIGTGHDHNLINTFCAINAGYFGLKQIRKKREKEGE